MKPSKAQALALEAYAKSKEGKLYGLHWGNPLHAQSFKWLPDHVGDLLEIGSGGGRWTEHLPARCDRLHIMEGTPVSFDILFKRIRKLHIETFQVCHDGDIGLPCQSIDFALSMATFVHFERELFEGYFNSVGHVLKPGGRFMVQYARKWPGLEHKYDNYCDEIYVLALASKCGMQRAADPVQVRGGYGSQVELFVRCDASS